MYDGREDMVPNCRSNRRVWPRRPVERGNEVWLSILRGTWEGFEAWIRDTVGSEFRWRVRPADTPVNREVVAEVILNNIERGNGTFPDKNAFIERAKDQN